MAMVSCRECGSGVSAGAKTCPHCGIEKPAASNYRRAEAFKTISGLVILATIALGLFYRPAGGTCTIENIEGREEVFITAGEPDYGAVVSVALKNDGPERDLDVEVRLETSTGDLTKAVTVAVAENSTRTIDVQFPEPVLGTEMQRVSATCA